ncbi:hypothetical protein [Micromonospora arborensis]|uniref:hypothetical protein n=1 Tax=Micromonospora arborensis TaxID=2116518 RepID=UPI001FC9CF78|nr:hypothetical protein [Micromonospora arborensis]
MNLVTGRRAARDHEDRPTGPAVGDDPGPEPAAPRSAGVAPQPRLVPGIDPGPAQRPSPTPRPSPDPRPSSNPGPDAGRPEEEPAASGRAADSGPAAAQASGEAVEVEPTTGAPVDAVPSRVPVRQQSRRHSDQRPAGDTPDDDSVFWAPIEQVHWDGTPVREDPPPERDRSFRWPGRRSPSRPAPPPDPLPGLAALVVLSLVAAFFAWVSAGPFWLAVGHARVGTVVIDDCTGGGLTQRCRGIFTAEDGRFIAHGVKVSGVPAGGDVAGARLTARMTGPDSGTAYADAGLGRHLRWLPGLLAVLACTAGIVRWTGSARLPGRRHRRWAVAAAIAGPALITVGFLVAAW